MKTSGPDDHAAKNGEIPHAEYEARLIYSLLRSAVQLARRARLSSKRLQELSALAYFNTLRADGATLREIAEIFGQTERSVANLAQRAKGHFLSPERDNSLPRRIEFHLWKGPQRIDALVELLPDWSREEIGAALETLCEQGRATATGEHQTFQVNSRQAHLLQKDIKTRIDGLNNLVDAVGDLVESRFLDENPAGMARTMTFRANESALATLKDEMFSLLLKHCTLVDSAADEDDESYYLVYALAPVINGRVR